MPQEREENRLGTNIEDDMISRSIALMHAAIEATADGILVADEGGLIERYNRKFLDMFGLDSFPLGTHISELQDPDPAGKKNDFAIISKYLLETYAEDEGEKDIFLDDGRAYHLRVKSRIVGGERFGVVWSFADRTKALEAQRHIEKMAKFDPLTGLPNRYSLEAHLDTTIEQSKKNRIPVNFLFIDLDHFKTINDSLGHGFGDELLKSVGKRFQEASGNDGFVSRFGGDEFVIITNTPANDFLNRIKNALGIPFTVNHQKVWCTISAGIAVYPSDGDDFMTLLQNADAALHSSKQYGRNGWHFFDPSMTEKQHEKMRIGMKLRKGLEEKAFRLVWQPKINLEDGRVFGAEALLRWRDEDGKDISPLKVIPILEETGLIIPVGEMILDKACEFIHHLDGIGFGLDHLSVNLSVRQFRDIELCEKIGVILERHSIGEHRLELEVTESVFADGDISQIVIDTLNSMGILVAIDDFGTGYSNLSYLKDFKLHTLKIDRSFVRDVTVDERARAMFNAIVSLSKSLGLSTVAEGAETAEQVEYLRNNGCDAVQGYYFAKPMEEHQFIEWLDDVANGKREGITFSKR